MNIPLGSIAIIALYNEHGFVIGIEPSKNPYGTDTSWYNIQLFDGRKVSFSILDYHKKWWIIE